jgi:hypothetical protein
MNESDRAIVLLDSWIEEIDKFDGPEVCGCRPPLIFVDIFFEGRSGTASTMVKIDLRIHLFLSDTMLFSPPMAQLSQTLIDRTKSLRISNGIALLLMKVFGPQR